MQLRISRVTRGAKTYEYAQLVESFRRPDGVPTHRVVAHLGALSAAEIANLRTALAANRDGKRVTLLRGARFPASAPKVIDNLRYLDVAVLLDVWKSWGLHEALDELIPIGAESVSPASIVAALTIQRCVAPGSKLFATQWFPRTALPELLGIVPTQFNNTRLHRVLDELERVGPALMAKLPRRYLERDRSFVALFLDVTDAWFVGHGPELAEPGKTKEGLIQRKIGIVLLCNEHGYPLRWDVIPGAMHDSKSMTAMVEAVAKLSWVGEAPLVCDRAMGKTAQILTLASSGIRFLTALTVPEFPSYAQGLPDPGGTADEAEAVRAVTRAGMNKVEDNLYVLDLGNVDRMEEHGGERCAEATVQQALQIARRLDESLNSGEHVSLAAAGRALGMSKQLASKYRLLSKLTADIQREVLEGKADGRSLAELLAIARMPPEGHGQEDAFRALLGSAASHQARRVPGGNSEAHKSIAFTVRVLAYFNPQRFVEKRERAKRHLEQIEQFRKELNGALESPRTRRTRDSVAAAVDRRLREADLLGAYAVSINEQKVGDRTRFSVALTLHEEEWARRRRYDGFTVLVAHPSLGQTAEELCRLYRAKDAVEKDFQVIKSLVELRPVHHRTDEKVRAHVTVCMLSLLLERTLRRRLEGKCSSAAALEALATCHLNRLKAKEDIIYSLTEPTEEQRGLLKTLRLERLVSDDLVVEGLSPR